MQVSTSTGPRAALFDMDRTLVRIDTATLYVRYQRKLGEIGVRDSARVAWWLLQYTLGVVDAERVAEQALLAYRGKEERWLVERCRVWFEEVVIPHVCEAGRAAVKQHRERGDPVAIVTGATRYAATPLAQLLGIEHVACTELEVDPNGYLTGRMTPPLCFGHGKVERVGRIAEAMGFSLHEATFYSDSITDLPLLEMVREPVVINPDFRLRRVARRRGWRIERW